MKTGPCWFRTHALEPLAEIVEGLHTGPRSTAGKARSSRNALKHGLSVPVTLDPAREPEVEAIVEAIAGDTADPRVLFQARLAAEAEVDLLRVRRARTDLFEVLHQDVEEHGIGPGDPVHDDPLSEVQNRLGLNLPGIVEMMRNGLSEQQFARFHARFLKQSQALLNGRTTSPTASSETLRKLASLDRYERRALSRRAVTPQSVRPVA
jgi:hypothetical protein